VTPFPVPIARIRRAVLSTGSMAVQAGQWFRLPAPSPVPFWLQRLSLLRWVEVTMAHHTFAGATRRCLLNGIPGSRLPGSAIYPRFRPLRTSRGSGGYAVTPAPGGRGLHPHGELSYKTDVLRLTREPGLSFSQRIARDPLQHPAALVRLSVRAPRSLMMEWEEIPTGSIRGPASRWG
jgi:hypothetical protein